jgi:hypothetical protein
LLNLVTVLSLVLCAATLFLWARSYHACDALVRPSAPGDRVCVTSEFGVLVFEVEAPLRDPVLPVWEYFDTPLPRRWPVRPGRLGFEAYRGSVAHFMRLPPATVWGVAVPHWAVALAVAGLPAWRGGRSRKPQPGRGGFDFPHTTCLVRPPNPCGEDPPGDNEPTPAAF